MFPEERRDRIVSYVDSHNTATVRELTEALGSSAATIRRDLLVLQEENRIIKVFGGATSLRHRNVNAIEPSVSEKAMLNVREKKLIAEYAASLIEDDDFVYIDSGTTTLYFVDQISNTRAKYITNGIVHAKHLLERGLPTMMIGGIVKPVTEAIAGSFCVDSLSRFHFTKAFLGTNGISLPAGFSTPDVDEALVKTEAVRRAYAAYVLADHSKFGVTSSVTFSNLWDCTIITDKMPDREYTEQTIVKVVSQK